MAEQAYLLNQLKILTLNCQGLRDKSKCRDVFNNLKQKNHNVYFLQDTHFTPNEENQIQTLWGYKAYFNSYASNSRGVAILFNNNCEIEIHNQYKDDSGNFLILDVTIDSLQFLLINIYGPNTDVPEFYSQLLEQIEGAYSFQYIIIGGDFNLVLDQDLDTMNYKKENNTKSRQQVLNIMDILNLIDVFRENNPKLRRYSWRRRNPIKQSRLDFFLISETFLTLAPKIYFDNSYRSDHSPVVLCFKTNEFKKGKGY